MNTGPHASGQRTTIPDSLDCGSPADTPSSVLDIRTSALVQAELPDPPPRKLRALILKGGGVKGLAFAGALEVLEKYYEFEMYAGTSAGAIAATLLGAGYDAGELRRILTECDFSKFKDTPPALRLLRLIFRGGMHSGDAFRRWMRGHLNQKVRRASGILLEDLTEHRVVVFASSWPRGRLTFDSKGRGADIEADFAVRCSMAIPYLFDAAWHNGRRVVDGGVLNNFPVRAIVEEFPFVGESFLALYLGATKIPDHRSRWLLGELLSMWLGQDELTLVDKYEDKIIVIDPAPIRTTDFDLKPEEKDFLICQGRAAGLEFIRRQQLPNGPTADEVEGTIASAEAKRERVIRDRQRKRRFRMVKTAAAMVVLSAPVAWFHLRDDTASNRNPSPLELEARIVQLENRLPELTEGQVQNLDEERASNPEKFRRVDAKNGFVRKLWPIGKTLRIQFLNGDTLMQQRVQATAQEWTEFANITFDFVTSAPADIRIRLASPSGGSWSLVGTDALAVPPQEPTMILGIESLPDVDVRFVVLHEFGHLLGLLHEAKNPNATIAWDRAAVARTLNHFSQADLDHHFFKKEDIPAQSYRPFDPLSVMWYRIPDEWLRVPIEQRTRSNLSESDKQFISRLYPP